MGCSARILSISARASSRRPSCPRAAAAIQRAIFASGVIAIVRFPQRTLCSKRRKEMRGRCDGEGGSRHLVVERVHALRRLDLSDRLVALAADAVDRSGPVAHEGRIGVHLDRPVSELERLIEPVPKNAVGKRCARNACTVVRSRRKGATCSLASLIDCAPPAALIPAVGCAAGNAVGQRAQCLTIPGIQIDGLLQQRFGAKDCLSGLRVVVRERTQIGVVGGETAGRLGKRAFDFNCSNGRLDGADDPLRDLVLQRKDVAQVALVAVGPDVTT